MLSICLGIMSAADTVTEFFGGSYVEALREENHEKWGVPYAARQVQCQGPMTNLNFHPATNLSTFRVDYQSHEAVAKILGWTRVYLTPVEAEFVSQAEEARNWWDEYTISVMRFIRSQQQLRAQFYNASRNG